MLNKKSVYCEKKMDINCNNNLNSNFSKLKLESTIISRMMILIVFTLVVACINTRLNLLYLVLALLLSILMFALILPFMILALFKTSVDIKKSSQKKNEVFVTYSFNYKFNSIRYFFQVFNIEKLFYSEENIIDKVYGVKVTSRFNSVSYNEMQILPFSTVIDYKMDSIEKKLDFKRRGKFSIIETALCIQLPPGILVWKICFPQDHSIEINPSVDNCCRNELLTFLKLPVKKNSFCDSNFGKAKSGTGVDDFMRVRRYEDGDPINLIHWKKVSSDDTMFVKVLGSIKKRIVHIVLDTSASRFIGLYSWSNIEAAICITTELTRILCEEGNHVKVHIGNDKPVLECRTINEIVSFQQSIACVRLSESGEYEKMISALHIKRSESVIAIQLENQKEIIDKTKSSYSDNGILLFCFSNTSSSLELDNLENSLNDSLDLEEITVIDTVEKNKIPLEDTEDTFEKIFMRLDPAQSRYREFPYYRMKKASRIQDTLGKTFRLLENGRILIS